MILETIRVLADALADPATGINAELEALPLDTGDSEPPKVAAVLDETRHEVDAALDWPVLTVTLEAPAEVAGGVGAVYRDGTVILGVRYVTADTDMERVGQDTLYTLRAMVRVVRGLMLNARLADRQRIGVTVQVCQGLTYGPLEEDSGEGVATGALVAEFRVRDGAP